MCSCHHPCRMHRRPPCRSTVGKGRRQLAAAAPGSGGPTCSGGAAVARHCSRAARATRGRAPEERSAGALLLFRAAALGARAAMLDALQCLSCNRTRVADGQEHAAAALRGPKPRAGLLGSGRAPGSQDAQCAVASERACALCSCSMIGTGALLVPRGTGLPHADRASFDNFGVCRSPSDRRPAMGTACAARPAGALLPLLLLLACSPVMPLVSGEPTRCSACRAVAVRAGSGGRGSGGGATQLASLHKRT